MFYRVRIINRLRKRQRCFWCHSQIIKGDYAVYESGMGEDFFHNYYHSECFRALDFAQHIGMIDSDDDWYFESHKRGRLEYLYDECEDKTDIPQFGCHMLTKEELKYRSYDLAGVSPENQEWMKATALANRSPTR